jgi:carbamoyltransferase
VDYSARVQTVHKDTNPRYHALISRFNALTGCPVIVNTSFNVRGEPIVGSPGDAFRCFMGTEMDVLAVGNCLLFKDQQDPALKVQYAEKFDLD